jgi:hypothetical protein
LSTVTRLIATSALLLAVAAAPAAAVLPRQPVPVTVEQRIAAGAGTLAYTPSRMMTGWRYTRWQYVPGELRVWFANRSGWPVEFRALPLGPTACTAGRQKTFQLDGNKVYWSQTTDTSVEYVQQAWRCVRHPSGRWIRLVASSTIPPTKLADVGLGQVASAGRLIRR